jgi:hypothetical protein
MYILVQDLKSILLISINDYKYEKKMSLIDGVVTGEGNGKLM